jgi:Starter unit:ACP transacylase in aflatoxin biosynthesis
MPFTDRFTNPLDSFLEHKGYSLWGEVRVLGACTGLIASSIAASCLSLPSLIPLAVEAVRIAFRIGFKVASIADQIEELSDIQDTWASTVTGLTVEEAVVALAEFHKRNVRNCP